MKYFAVLNQSGVHCGTCTLGVGTSEKEAIQDAFDPSLTLAQAKKQMKKIGAWVQEIDEDVYNDWR